jgi:hypothetical protein
MGALMSIEINYLIGLPMTKRNSVTEWSVTAQQVAQLQQDNGFVTTQTAHKNNFAKMEAEKAAAKLAAAQKKTEEKKE